MIVGASLAVFLGLAGPLALTAGYDAVASETCQEVEIVDLDIPRIVAMKRRKEAWQAADGLTGPLELSADEVSFLGRGAFEGEARVWFFGSTARVVAALPRGDRCFNIDFVGTVEIVDGVLRIQPTSVTVGTVTIASWTWGPVEPDRARLDAWGVPDLTNVRRVRVEHDRLLLELHDPWALPW